MFHGKNKGKLIEKIFRVQGKVLFYGNMNKFFLWFLSGNILINLWIVLEKWICEGNFYFYTFLWTNPNGNEKWKFNPIMQKI